MILRKKEGRIIAKRGEVRKRLLKFLEENAGRRIQVYGLSEKIGVKQGSIYAILSDLRKLGILPKPDAPQEHFQPVPADFNAERALERLRSLQRKRDEKRFM